MAQCDVMKKMENPAEKKDIYVRVYGYIWNYKEK